MGRYTMATRKQRKAAAKRKQQQMKAVTAERHAERKKSRKDAEQSRHSTIMSQPRAIRLNGDLTAYGARVIAHSDSATVRNVLAFISADLQTRILSKSMPMFLGNMARQDSTRDAVPCESRAIAETAAKAVRSLGLSAGIGRDESDNIVYLVVDWDGMSLEDAADIMSVYEVPDGYESYSDIEISLPDYDGDATRQVLAIIEDAARLANDTGILVTGIHGGRDEKDRLEQDLKNLGYEVVVAEWDEAADEPLDGALWDIGWKDAAE